MHEYRHQCRGPIVHVQNLQLRCQPPRLLQRRFAEKNKSRRVIFVRLAPLAVNSRAIEKFVTADQKQLDATGAPAFKVTRSVNPVTHLHIESYAAILFLECAVLSNLAVKWQRDADLVATSTQRARQ